MALPWLIGAAAVAAAAYIAKEVLDDDEDDKRYARERRRAAEREAAAERKAATARKEIQASRERTLSRLQDLERLKSEVFSGQIARLAAETKKHKTTHGKPKSFRAKIEQASIPESIEDQEVFAALRQNVQESEDIIDELACSFDLAHVQFLAKKSDEHFQRLLAIGKTLKQALDTPIMKKDGSAVDTQKLKTKFAGFRQSVADAM